MKKLLAGMLGILLTVFILVPSSYASVKYSKWGYPILQEGQSVWYENMFFEKRNGIVYIDESQIWKPKDQTYTLVLRGHGLVEDPDDIVVLKGLPLFRLDVEARKFARENPNNAELYLINGQPWQLFNSTAEVSSGVSITNQIQFAFIDSPNNPYNKLRPLLPPKGKRKVVLYLDNKILANYTSNNVELSYLPVKPNSKNGVTLIPLKGVVESLGSSVQWNSATKSIQVKNSKGLVELKVGSNIAKINGKEVKITRSPEIINGTTMIPLRFVSENLGYQVDWLGSGKPSINRIDITY
ncbi:copper amine oxidase N-terminal domain-containing protein [Patescibacteria group bacterium]|nr:copper amine oxidase N-terminal domain-containing protein [Patescibacteria group bacterium]